MEKIIVNTCDFIDLTMQESFNTIGEVLAENDKMLVAGALGTKKDEIIEFHLDMLGVADPHAYGEVLAQVHEYVTNLSFFL